MSFAVFIILAAVLSVCYVFRSREPAELQEHNLVHPEFPLEVMYKGKVVAYLSDPEATDMFWSSYQITPLNDQGRDLILTDTLWDSSQFYFRDPKSGTECHTGFAGGKAPFIQSGRISLRALHFVKAKAPLHS